MIAGGAQRLMAAVLDCEKPVIARGQRHRGRHRRPPGLLLRPGRRRRPRQVRRGLRPPWSGARRRGRMAAPPHHRHPEDEGAVLPRRRPPGDRGRGHRPRQPGRARPMRSPPTVDELAGRLAAAPTISLSLAKRLVNRSLDVDRATAFRDEAAAQELQHDHARRQRRRCVVRRATRARVQGLVARRPRGWVQRATMRSNTNSCSRRPVTRSAPGRRCGTGDAWISRQPSRNAAVP